MAIEHLIADMKSDKILNAMVLIAEAAVNEINNRGDYSGSYMSRARKEAKELIYKALIEELIEE